MSHAGTEAKVVVVGEINPDIVVTDVQTPLAFGQQEDLAGPTSMTVGSSVAITACGLARLGTPTSIVGVVGDDPFGHFMVAQLRVRGVDVGAIRTVPDGRTGLSVILVRGEDPTDRQILTDPGVMGDLRAVDVTVDLLDRAHHLHIGSWFLHRGAVADLPDLLTEARSRGLSTSVDPNDDPARTWDAHLVRALPAVEMLFCNESEARGLAGSAGWAGGSRDEAARYLLDRLAANGAVVLKCGAEGAHLYQHGPTLHVAAPIVEVVDTVGAGDSLTAGLLHARLQGAGLEDALRMAVAAGTLSTQRSGGVDAQPTAGAARSLAQTLTCIINPEHRRSDT